MSTPTSRPSSDTPIAGRAGSYAQILKASSVIGGAQVFIFAIGLLRTKLVAVLLGPAGVGLIGLYSSAVSMVGVLSDLGVSSSAVRQVAEAAGCGDLQRISCTIRVLRRTCLFSGTLGLLMCIVFARPLSEWTFGTPEHTWPIALLGLSLLLGSISNGRTTMIQGLRRIGDLARLQVLGVITAALISIPLYAFLGERGIVPALLLSSGASLVCALWYARRVEVPVVHVSWEETLSEASRLITLGLAFMWSALLNAAVAFATRALIVQEFGVDANGFYQSAWTISGMFVGFVLSAMGADFYPRLTAAARDHSELNNLVNEQTEVGILLGLPGLLATLVFSPLVIQIFYTEKFSPSAEMLPWFILGIYGRIVSWPMGFVQPALGASRWFAITETVICIIHMVLVWLSLQFFGLKGVSIAFASLYIVYIPMMLFLTRHLSGFHWTRGIRRLIWASALILFCTFLLSQVAPAAYAYAIGGVISAAAGCFCFRALQLRLGPTHRITVMMTHFRQRIGYFKNKPS